MQDILLWSSVTLVLLVIIYFIIRWLHHRQITKEIERVLQELNIEYELQAQQRGDFNWWIETEHAVIICKLFHIQRHENLVITNPTTWIRTKKSEPIRIENRLLGVTRFLKLSDVRQTDKPIYKVAILHPTPLQIRQYINENEMVIVDINQKVYDYYFFSTSTLSDGFRTLLK